MRFGHFDDLAREYCLERPDTPRPWSTFLGAGEFGGFADQHGGGVCLPRESGRAGGYAVVPLSTPGRPVYLRDRESADYWSATWQPVGKPLSGFRTAVRMAPGALAVVSEWRALQSELVYFVPVDGQFEVWWLRLANRGVRRRQLTVFACVDFTVPGGFAESIERDGFMVVRPAGRAIGDTIGGEAGAGWWMTILGGEPAGHDGDRQRFRGRYRGAQNPEAVERGVCSRSSGYAERVCAAMARNLALEPDGTAELIVLVGPGEAGREGAAARAAFARPGRVSRARARVRGQWRGWIDRLRVQTPDPDFDRLCNDWGAIGAIVAAERATPAALAEASLGATTLRPDLVCERLAMWDPTGSEAALEVAARALAIEALLGETGDCDWAVRQLAPLASALATVERPDAAARSAVRSGWYRVADLAGQLGLADLRGRAAAALTRSESWWSGELPETLELDPAIWAILAGEVEGSAALALLDAIEKRLGTAHGLVSRERPIVQPGPPDNAGWIGPGHGRNGGVLVDAQARFAWAAAQLGDGDRAFSAVQTVSPLLRNDGAEVRELEPFAYGADIHSVFSPRPGLGGRPWSSSAASWMRYTIERWVLGLRPEVDGLRIDPCIPSAWTGFIAQRTFRGVQVPIEVRAPAGIGHGLVSLLVDGTAVPGNLVPLDLLHDGVRVVATLGVAVERRAVGRGLVRRI